MEKTCKKCGETKGIIEFPKGARYAGGYKPQCRECERTTARNSYAAKPKVTAPLSETKRCRQCEKIKDASDFVKRLRSSDGLSLNCKECLSRYNTRETAARKREYMATVYGPKNRARKRRYDLEYREKNRDSISAKKRDKFQNDAVFRAARLAYLRAYGQRHRQRPDFKEKHAARVKRWAATEHGKANELARRQKRRAAKAQNGGQFNSIEWRALCSIFDNKCAQCGKIGKLTADHVLPLSKGGSSYIWNIQPLCLFCNLSKGAKIADFRDRILIWAA